MSISRSSRFWVAGSLSLLLMAGCQAAPAGLAGADVPTAATPAEAAATAGLAIAAEIDGQPFAGAHVSVYRPGQAEPIATGTTDAQGQLTLAVGRVIAAGDGNVIAAGGGNVIAAGDGNVIAAGGGNILAGGTSLFAGTPLKVIATKDGQTLAGVGLAEVIAAGGGNVIAAGGGNVIAAGGLNYRVQQAANKVLLTPATTLAVLALGYRLDGAMATALTAEGRVLEPVAQGLKAAYDALSASGAQALAAAPARAALQTQILQAFSSAQGKLTEATLNQLIAAYAPFKEAFKSSLEQLGRVMVEGVKQGGTAPSSTQAGEVSSGGVSASSVPVTTNSASGTSGVTGPIVGAVSGVTQTTGGALGGTAGQVVETTTGVVTDAVGTVTNTAGQVVDSTAGVVTGTTGAVSDAVSNTTGAVTGVIGGLTGSGGSTSSSDTSSSGGSSGSSGDSSGSSGSSSGSSGSSSGSGGVVGGVVGAIGGLLGRKP